MFVFIPSYSFDLISIQEQMSDGLEIPKPAETVLQEGEAACKVSRKQTCLRIK